ncbi:39S ribosomal protein L37, mitochondrial [Drosophila ficusphila]|uniref:39S ribosomal protein L37, mitochondrial n=1 Tax=Drosophila ficusphila TaxID=30025 RepID=UPI0007E8A334|nr:39S ribosomal protein L37, mitochondrial [Drosophila ficusphila]
MRLTNKLCAQHIGWHFKKHWLVQGKRVPKETGAAAELLKLGVQVKNPEDLVNAKIERKLVDIVGTREKTIPEDSRHPDWHSTVCHSYSDKSVLIGGLPQAQVLTNSIEIQTFPKQIEDAIASQQLPNSVDKSIRHAILASHVLDAEQVKLPKVSVPDRPAFNLPRSYGISHERVNRLLVNKLLQETEKLAGRPVSIRRKIIDNATFKSSLSKDGELFGFSINAEKVVFANRAIEAVKGKFEVELPDLYPMKSTISIPKRHIYQTDNFYPLRTDISCSNPHTIFTVFNKHQVRNAHGSEVSLSQLQARTLVKAFVVATARAKQLHGDSLNGALPKPIVVQSVQTDGRTFHFGVLQLNTLDLGANSTTKNYWFHRPNYDIFSECSYEAGRTHLENYNGDVFRIFNAFYNNS